MTDLLRERLAALADPVDDSDWREVRRRAGHRGGRSRILLPLAAGLAALVAGSAFAYYGDVVDFGSAERAPRESVEFFEELAVGAPPGMDPRAIPDETRRIEIAGLAGDSKTVYIAPTRAGGLCELWDHGAGGCDKLGRTPIGLMTWGRRGRGTGLTAHVDARYVARVELRFPDGRVLEPPVTWVSAPIDRGFLFYDFAPGESDGPAPLEGIGIGRPGVTVVALDDEGRVVTEQSTCCELGAPQADALVEEKTATLSIEARGRRAVIWTAPTRYESTCSWLEYGASTEPVSCLPDEYGDEGFALRVYPTTDTVLVFGVGADRYGAMELRYADGARQRVELEGRYFLTEIPERHLEPSTKLVAIAWYDESGREVPPKLTGMYDSPSVCFHPLRLPPGHTCT